MLLWNNKNEHYNEFKLTKLSFLVFISTLLKCKTICMKKMFFIHYIFSSDSNITEPFFQENLAMYSNSNLFSVQCLNKIIKRFMGRY